jgi:hypothetical protein
MPARLAFAAALLPVASACSLSIGNDRTHEEVLHITEPVLGVRVELGAGNVELIATDVTTVDVTAKIKGEKNHLRQQVQGDTLVLSIECAESPCGTHIRATVPRAARLAATTGSADVALQGTRGAIQLETGSGDITLAGFAGTELKAHTGSGDVNLDVAEPSRRLSIHTGSGDVRLRVPTGKYRLALDTGSGNERVNGIVEDSAAERTIDVDTGSGDVLIDGA